MIPPLNTKSYYAINPEFHEDENLRAVKQYLEKIEHIKNLLFKHDIVSIVELVSLVSQSKISADSLKKSKGDSGIAELLD